MVLTAQAANGVTGHDCGEDVQSRWGSLTKGAKNPPYGVAFIIRRCGSFLHTTYPTSILSSSYLFSSLTIP